MEELPDDEEPLLDPPDVDEGPVPGPLELLEDEELPELDEDELPELDEEDEELLEDGPVPGPLEDDEPLEDELPELDELLVDEDEENPGEHGFVYGV